MTGATRIDLPKGFSGHGGSVAMHVDDTRFLGNTQEWLAAVRSAGDHLRKHPSNNCNCLSTLAFLAGMAAHTIQDFYHHTDWFFEGGGVDFEDGIAMGFRRWDETKVGASKVRTGSGWVKSGNQNGLPRSEARVGSWYHDPWGDHKKDRNREGLPSIPAGFGDGNRLAYLNHVTSTVIIPHTREYLKAVLGDIDPGAFADGDAFKGRHSMSNRFYDGEYERNQLRSCFGDELGGTLAKYAIDQRGHPRMVFSDPD